MSGFGLVRPRIPTHFYVFCDPPDDSGDETLHFLSSTRRVKLRGHSFREFVQHVVPLLDGYRTFEEIKTDVADLFAEDDLLACLELLAGQGLLEDAERMALQTDAKEVMQPQNNLFYELGLSAAGHIAGGYQHNLASACIGIFGLTGAGLNAATALAASGVGRLRLLDDNRVAASDVYFSPVFGTADIGHTRATALASRLKVLAPQTQVETVDTPLLTDEAIASALAGVDFVVNCADEGNLGLVFKLNRVCLNLAIPWTSASPGGLEIILGPTVIPGETACYMCYSMRLVACADSPETEFKYQSFLDRRKHDDSGRHANLVSGVALAGQMAALEAVKAVSGFAPPACRGRVVVFDLRELTAGKHVVLRKPWCPACFPNWETET